MGVEEEQKREEPQESKEEEETSTVKDDHQHEEKNLTNPIPEERDVAGVPQTEKCSVHSCDRHVTLNRVETKKKSAVVKAWEESQKCKADNMALKNLSAIASWENNKMAKVHRAAEVKRAKVEARKGARLLKLEDKVAKYRTTGTTPRMFFTSCWRFSNKF